MIWYILEWLGTLLALSGSFILASKRSLFLGLIIWIISNIIFIILFLGHTHQLGLVFMQSANLFINILGIWQYYKGAINNNKYIRNGFYLLSIILISVSLYCLIIMIREITLENKLRMLEWIGSLLSVSAGLLLASYHKKSKYCWALWLLANILILTLTTYTKQYGFMILQIGFSMINFYGTWNWILKPLWNKLKK